MEKNFFWQKTFLVLETAKTAILGLVDIGLGKKDNSSQPEFETVPDNTAATAIAAAAPAVVESASGGSFWSDTVAKIKEEWQRGGDDPGTVASPDVAEAKFLEYQKTATGAEIIFREKSGQEHKLPLPFKFLSE